MPKNLGLIVLFGSLFATHCNVPAKTVENGIVDLANAVCTALVDTVPSSTVDFICTVENAAAGVVSQFTIRVPAADAQTFAVRHAGPRSALDAGAP